jgi:fibronectin-binding autotransporter adhesin
MTKTSRSILVLLTAGILVIAVPQRALPGTLFNWQGLPVGNWSDGAHWSCGASSCPAPNSPAIDVYLTGASLVNQDLASVTVNSVTLGNANLAVLAGNTLKAVSYANVSGGSVTVQDRGTLSLGQQLAGFGSVYLQSTGGITQLQLGNNAAISLSSSVVLSGLNSNSLDRITGINGNESVVNSGAISGAGQIVGLSKLSNYGTITGGGISQPILYIQSNTFDNTFGTVKATPGGAVRIESPNFVNLFGSSLEGGDYDTAGKIMLNGNISTIGPSTAVVLRGSGFISTLGGTTNALYGLSLNEGVLSIQGGGNQQFGAPILTNASIGTIYVDQGSTLSTGFIQNASGGNIIVGQTASGTLKATGLLNDGSLTVLNGTADFRSGMLNSFNNLNAPDETLYGGSYYLGAGATLIYDAGSGTYGGEIINIGPNTTLDLNRGGQLQYGPGQQDALAQLSGNAGTLYLDGGQHTFNPLAGQFSNSGLLAIDAAGASATIGGRVSNSGSILIDNTSRLTASGLTNSNGASLSVSQGTLNLTAAGFTNLGAATVVGGSVINTAGVVENGVGGTLQIGTSGVDPSTYYDSVFASQALVSGGTVSILANGRLQVSDYSQTGGTLELEGGLVNNSTGELNGGVVDGYGQFNGNLNNYAGTMVPDGGDIFVADNYTQGGGGTLSEALGSGDFLAIGGNANLDGTFDGTVPAGMNYQLGDLFEIVAFDGTLTGNFSTFDLPTLSAGLSWKEVEGANEISLEVVTAASTATPEPGTLSLFAGALLLGVGVSRRRVKK